MYVNLAKHLRRVMCVILTIIIIIGNGVTYVLRQMIISHTFSNNHNIIDAVFFRCDFLLSLFYAFSFVACIRVLFYVPVLSL